MGATSAIEWTQATWNPLVGCMKVSAGCDHCYAETLVNRFAGKNSGFPNRFDVVTLRGDKMLTQPLHWRAPKRIFVNSLSDLFHQDVPDEFIAKVFVVMAMARQHTFQLLTKRHARMRSLLSSPDFQLLAGRAAFDLIESEKRPVGWQWPLPNVWLGVSVENQQWADIRIPALLETPAAVRWISAEPLLGPVTLRWANWQPLGTEPGAVTDHLDGLRRLEWVVAGGESGPGARPMHPDWARSLRDQCVTAGVPFLFKQWGNWRPLAGNECAIVGDEWPAGTQDVMSRNVGKKAAGRELDGRTWDEYPAVAA